MRMRNPTKANNAATHNPTTSHPFIDIHFLLFSCRCFVMNVTVLKIISLRNSNQLIPDTTSMGNMYGKLSFRCKVIS